MPFFLTTHVQQLSQVLFISPSSASQLTILSPSSSPTPVAVPQSPSSLVFLILSFISFSDLISRNALKRKERPADDGSDDPPQEKPPSSTSTGNTARPDEYEAGFITCQSCGTEVSFRDDKNGFTTKLWDAHRMTW